MASTDYATVAQIKAQIEKTGVEFDAVITAMIGASSRAIDNFCNRPDGFEAEAVASARTYAGRGKSTLLIDETTTITAVAMKDSVTDDTYTALAADDWAGFSGDPRRPDFNSVSKGKPFQYLMTLPLGTNGHNYWTSGYYRGRQGFPPDPDSVQHEQWLPTVQVTARWGYALAVPDAINQACITNVARWFKRGEAAWSDVIARGDFGELRFVRELDPVVAFLLTAGRYVRPAVG